MDGTPAAYEQPPVTALLDAIPGCIALIVRKTPRTILAANAAARRLGLEPGVVCPPSTPASHAERHRA